MSGRLSVSLAVAALAVILVAAPDRAADAPAAFPRVAAVEAQPLLAQLKRLRQALDAIGEPLPADARAALDKLADEADGAKVAAEVQRVLDPLCALAVELTPNDKVDAA